MSVSISSSFLKDPATLATGENPIVAVKIVPKMGSESRRSFHLVLLLDTSGSMMGEGITSVIRTLHLLIDKMTVGDILTFIQYSSDAHILKEAVVISDESRGILHSTVDSLEADGGTNMEAAFAKLCEVHRRETNPDIDAVFIMTDGHINQGILSGPGLMRILYSGVPSGTPVNTLGYGSDHNSSLLRDIAVRSRGSYTYANSSELIPAVIGDIMGGLASEVGRNGTLNIPPGWICKELGVETTDTQYNVGTLIADKPQWVVLEGPSGVTDTNTEIEFRWTQHSIQRNEFCSITEDIPSIEVLEQQHRAHVANVFANVTSLIESHNYKDATSSLEELVSFLDASIAKDRMFVIHMRAQVDDMLQSIQNSQSRPHYNMIDIAGTHILHRQHAIHHSSMGATISRLASNTAALGVQRGFISGDCMDPTNRTPSGLHATFSSPAQRQVSHGFTQRYTQQLTIDPEDV